MHVWWRHQGDGASSIKCDHVCVWFITHLVFNYFCYWVLKNFLLLRFYFWDYYIMTTFCPSFSSFQTHLYTPPYSPPQPSYSDMRSQIKVPVSSLRSWGWVRVLGLDPYHSKQEPTFAEIAWGEVALWFSSVCKSCFSQFAIQQKLRASSPDLRKYFSPRKSLLTMPGRQSGMHPTEFWWPCKGDVVFWCSLSLDFCPLSKFLRPLRFLLPALQHP